MRASPSARAFVLPARQRADAMACLCGESGQSGQRLAGVPMPRRCAPAPGDGVSAASCAQAGQGG